MSGKRVRGRSKDELVRELQKLKTAARRSADAAREPNRERLIHELRLHEVELEMQNQELKEVHARLEESTARYADLYEFAPVGYCTLGLDGRIGKINLTASALLGVPREQLIGRLFPTAARLKERTPFLVHMRRCAKGGQRVTTEVVLAPRGSRGARVVQLVSDPVRDEHGEATECRTVLVDITDLKAMESRVRMLADSGAQLAASLDMAAVLDAAGRIVVPSLADLCLVDLVSPSGAIDRARVVFADSAKQSALAERMRDATPQEGWRSPQAQVIASGDPMLLSEVPEPLERPSPKQQEEDVMLSVGVKSLIVVPLLAHGRRLGALTLACAGSARRYSQVDLQLAVELANRLAVGFDNARLYQEAQRTNQLLLGAAKASGIVAISPDAMISVDVAQRITLWNDGAEKIFGYSRDEAIGAPIDMLLPERYRAVHRDYLARFAAGPDSARRMGERGTTIVALRKHGEEFPADAAISKLEVGGEKILTVALRDITEQQHIEQQQRALARLGQVLDSTLDYEETLHQLTRFAVESLADYAALYLCDDDGPARRTSAASRNSSAADPNDLIIAIDGDATAEHPVAQAIATRRPLVLEATPAVLASLAHNAEHRRTLDALNLRSVIALPLLIADRCLGALLLESATPYEPTDVTLAEMVARRMSLLIENSQLHRTAQAAIRARDDVLRIVAHDLRNPLSTIVMEADVLSMGEQGPMRSVAESAALIREAAHRMNRLIRDLLDITRIESGRLSVEEARLPVATTIADFVKGHELVSATAEIDLRADVAPDAGHVLADHDRLVQVLENLVGNAVRFTPHGGSITIGAKPRDGDVLFWVSDTGSGIDPAALPHLFDRDAEQRKVDRSGTGLGLPIVKGIVEAHRGRVWVESTIGKGTTVFFTLPRAKPRRRAHAKGRVDQHSKLDV